MIYVFTFSGVLFVLCNTSYGCNRFTRVLFCFHICFVFKVMHRSLLNRFLLVIESNCLISSKTLLKLGVVIAENENVV